jgi:DNA-binding MarR family transcriptional regulator
MDEPGILAAALLILLFIPFSTGASGTGEAGPGQPRIEWVGQEFRYHNSPAACMYCDTDKDGFEEIFLTIGDLVVLDPPSYKEVLHYSAEGLEIDMSIQDLGGNGHLQIVVCSRDYARHVINWTVFSGEDFSLLWRSPDISILRNAYVNWWEEYIVDVDIDGEKEFVMSSNDSDEKGFSAGIRVYGGVSFKLEWKSPAFQEPFRMWMENIDTDPALELIVLPQMEDNPWGLAIWSTSAVSVFDGATHQLQWELPRRDGVRLRPAAVFEAAAGDRGRSVIGHDIRDLTNDGIKDIVIEHQQYTGGGVTGSGFSVYSGKTGALEWNATTTGVIPEYSTFSRVLGTSDVDSDRITELIVLSPNATGASSDVTDVRFYSGTNGSLKYNISVAGLCLDDRDIINVEDIDSDGKIEILLTSQNEMSDGTCDITFEIFDFVENRSLWKMGPVRSPGRAELFAEDINRDGRAEVTFGNYTVSNKYRDGVPGYEEYIERSFQVLDGRFDVAWTSPVTVSQSRLNRMVPVRFDGASAPVLLGIDYAWEDGYHTNNTIRFFSMSGYQELGLAKFGPGVMTYHAEDILGDPRQELVVKIESGRTFSAKNATFHIIDTETFQKIWTSPVTKCTSDLNFFEGIDVTGDSGRELVFTGRTQNIFFHEGFEEYYMNWTLPDPYYSSITALNITMYDGSAQKRIWSSNLSSQLQMVVGAKDFDRDGNIELLISADSGMLIKMILVEFPKDGLWTDIPDWASINSPPVIISITGPVNITVDDPGQQTFGVDAIDPWGKNLTYEWMVDGRVLGSERNLTCTFPNGNHRIELIVTNGVQFTQRTFYFTVSSHAKPSSPQPLGPVQVAGAIAMCGAALALAFAARTEAGKYRLAGLLFPLYTRLRKEEMLDHETRGLLRGFICAEPGVHYNDILRRLKLKNGTASYHLMALEREGFIKSRSDGRLKRFYPAGMKIADLPPKLEPVQEIILKTVQQSEGLSQRELARVVGIPHSSVNRQVKKLGELGLLRLVKEGATTRCYLPETRAPMQ